MSVLGEAINESWRLQKNFSNFVGRGCIHAIEEAVQPMVHGLRGPGAGANSLFLFVKPNEKNRVLERLKKFENEVVIFFARVNKNGLHISEDVSTNQPV